MLTTTVNEDAAKRILVQDEEAKRAGFSDVEPWFAVGTRLIEAGTKAFKQSRMKYEQMPEAGEALPQFIAAIQAENRVDLDVKPEQLEMLEDGSLKVHSTLVTKPLPMTPAAFRQLARWLTDPREIANPASYLTDIEPERRARYINEEIHRSTQGFKLRTRTPNGHTEVFAVVSTRYTPADADAIAATLLKSVNPTTKVDVLYQGTRSKIDLVYHADLAPADVGVGEYYKASQTFRSNDDGTSAVTGGASLFRAICINLTTVEVTQEVLRRRHSGAQEGILAAVAQALELSYPKLRYFIETFAAKSKIDTRDLVYAETGKKYPFDSPRYIIEHLFDKNHKSWTIPTLNPAAVAAAAEQAWFQEDPDWSVAGLSNALSRAAHESAWRDLSHEQALQDRAGQLITAGSAPWGFVVPESAQ